MQTHRSFATGLTTLALLLLASPSFLLAQSADSNSAMPTYSNTTAGLEKLVGDMLDLAKKHEDEELKPYLESLVLPNAEQWFTSNFGDKRCNEANWAANDCLGPRMAHAYAPIAKVLPQSMELTLQDLIQEALINLEAVNFSSPCPNTRKINQSTQLYGSLFTTPFLSSSLSGLIEHHEPIYVVWLYNSNKQTTLNFFAYSDGAFRYLGMPHPVTPEEFRTGVIPGVTNQPPHILSNEQIDTPDTMRDPALVNRTAVLRVSVDKTGKPTRVEYIAGPEESKEAALREVRTRKFDPPGFSSSGLHPSDFSVSVLQ